MTQQHYQECSTISTNILRVCQDFLSSLLTLCEQVISEVTVLTTDIQVRLQRSDFRDISTEMNLLTTWRMEVLTLLLEVWQMILSPSNITTISLPITNGSNTIGSHVNSNNMNNTMNIVNYIELYALFPMDSTTHPILTDLLSHCNSNDPNRSITTLYGVLGEVLGKTLFPTLCESIITIFVNDSLISKEEEEFEEEDELFSATSLHSLLSGCVTLGRLNVDVSLSFINRVMSGALRDMQTLHSGGGTGGVGSGTGGGVGGSNMDVKEIYCLERARLAILLQSYLLVDDFMLTDGSSGTGGDDDGTGGGGTGGGIAMETAVLQRVSSVSYNRHLSGDTPVITLWLLHAFQYSPTNTLTSFFASIQSVGELLYFQQSLLQPTSMSNHVNGNARSTHGLTASPLLLQTIFRFFSAVIYRYMDPNLENYLQETIDRYPFLTTAASSIFVGKVSYSMSYHVMCNK